MGTTNQHSILNFFTNDSEGQRLDLWLAKKVNYHPSRNHLQQIIKFGNLKINGCPVYNPRFKLSNNLEISLQIPCLNCNPISQNIPLDILYEDKDIIVINKQAGLVVHPSNERQTGTLVNALIYHFGNNLSKIRGIQKSGIVHRLDKNTTGVMILAKNDASHRNLSLQFFDHGNSCFLKRKYRGLIWGCLKKNQGIINFSLVRSKKKRTLQQAVETSYPGSRKALTYYKTIEKFSQKTYHNIASLVEWELKTGRTHQIRVHTSYLGYPIIGDKEYGNSFKSKINNLNENTKKLIDKLQGQALHSYSLRIQHPSTKRIMTFSKDFPDNIQNIIEKFRLNISKY